MDLQLILGTRILAIRKHMKINKLAVMMGVLTLLVMGTGAYAQKIKYNYLQGTNFAQYKTYKWVKVENAQYPNQLLDNQIMQAIDTQLALKGLQKMDTGTPDLVVAYQVALNQEREWSSYNTGGGWGWGGWGGWGGMGGSTYGTTSTITVGTLNLDFYDVQTKKQIWRGEATKSLDPPKDPNKLQERINKAMAKLLKNYPPKPKN
jgi:hypothetical protein